MAHKRLSDLYWDRIGQIFGAAFIAADLHQHRVDPADKKASTELLTDTLKYRPDAVAAALTTPKE